MKRTVAAVSPSVTFWQSKWKSSFESIGLCIVNTIYMYLRYTIHLTLRMSFVRLVETWANLISFQKYSHPDNHTRQNTKWYTCNKNQWKPITINVNHKLFLDQFVINFPYQLINNYWYWLIWITDFTDWSGPDKTNKKSAKFQLPSSLLESQIEG